MRIETTENYRHEYDCPLDECERHYCRAHRTLWRDCDTARVGLEGDREVGTRKVYEIGDCPKCEAIDKKHKLFRDLRAHYPGSAICPVCFDMKPKSEADTIAVHLMSDHGWEIDKVTVWLREEMEQRHIDPKGETK